MIARCLTGVKRSAGELYIARDALALEAGFERVVSCEIAPKWAAHCRDRFTGNEGVSIFDCIEFDRRYRCVDVAADLAFLLMDLDLRGFRAFAGYLLDKKGRKVKLLALPLYYCVVNAASVAAFFRTIMGKKAVTWETVRQ